jgi:Na+/H+-dicarboxylate symporter
MKLRKPSAFMQVIIGLFLGLFVGLFLGEPAGQLGMLGTAYIRLLQMTVLPYVVVSLIGGVGRLSAQQARMIGSRGGALILFLWSVALITLTTLPLGYPDWEAASFFSVTLLEEPVAFDPLALYLTANPFHALANTIVPASVVFCIAVGVALIGVPNKDGLLGAFQNLTDALLRVTSGVVKLAPYGIFAITANAAGTLRLEELGRLQVFLWVYVLAWALLLLLVLPALVAWGTPFSYREVMRRARTPVITGIATGSVLVVLPMIAERCKELLEEKKMDHDDAMVGIDVLVPTAYSFPSVGTLLGLGFILFAAWFVGAPLGVEQYPAFVLLGLFTAFGTMNVALPFLLDFLRLQADLFQLYLLGSVVTGRLSTGLAAMHAVVIALLGACAMLGQISWRRMAQAALASLGILAVSMFGLGLLIGTATPYKYTGDEVFVSMRLTDPASRAKIWDGEPPALSAADRERPRLDVITERGSIRIGYLPETLPMSFRNNRGEVVGYDIEMAHLLAADLAVTLEIVRLEREQGGEWLADGRIDMLVGVAISPSRAQHYYFSVPYFDYTLAFLVPDYLRNKFADIAKVRAMGEITIGVPEGRYLGRLLQTTLPQARFVSIPSPRPFLRGDRPDLDAVIWAAETGSAWTLIYPSYSVAVPRGLGIRVPGAYALPRGQGELRIFINRWLDLKLGDGTTQALFDHWILGKNVETRGPRWSILHDVLGWGKEAEGEPGAPASPDAPSGQETVTESDENTEET